MVRNPLSSRDPEVTVGIGGDASGINSAVESAVAGLSKLTTVAGAASAAVGAIGAVGISKSIKAFGDFDSALTESMAIMGDVSAEMEEQMVGAANQVARSTQFSAEQAAESYFFLASAGLDAAESVSKLDEVAQFAQAGQFDMATATDLLTDSASALNLEVSEYNELADVLVAANQQANASVEQFASSLTRQAGASMRAANIEMEEGVSVLAAFADQGIKGERAGTLFRRTLDQMQIAAEDNAEAFQELGIQVFDGEGELRNFADIVADMETAFGSLSTQQRNAAMSQLGFTVRTREGFNALIGNSDALREYRSELEDAGGASEEVAEKQLDTLNQQWGLFTDKLNTVAITLGSGFEGPLRDALSVVNSATDRLIALIDSVDETRLAFGAAGGTIASLGAAVGVFLSGPIGALIAASGLVLAAWSEDWAGIRDLVTSSLETVTEIWEDHSDEVEDVIDDVTDIIVENPEDALSMLATSVVPGPLGTITDAFEDSWDDIVETGEIALEEIQDTVESMGNTFDKQLVSPLSDAESDTRKTMGDLSESINGSLDVAEEAISGFVSAALDAGLQPFLQDVTGLWETHFTGPDGIVANAREAFVTISDEIIIPALDLIRAGWDLFGDDILEVAEGVFGTIATIVKIGLDGILTSVNVMLDLISGDWEGAWESIKGFGRRTIGEIADWLKSDAKGMLSGAIGIVISAIKAPFQALYNWLIGSSFFPDLITDISSFVKTSGKETLRTAFSSAIGAVSDLFTNWSIPSPDWPTPPAWLQDALNHVSGGIEDALDWISRQEPDDDDGGSPGPGPGGGGGGSSPAFGSSGESDRRARQVGSGGPTVGLDTGGLIEETGAAIVHAGERVIPEAQVSERGGIEAGTQIVIERLVASGRREGRDAGRALKMELRRFDV